MPHVVYQRDRPTVIIMERDQQSAKATLFKFVKYAVITMSINLVAGVIGFILMEEYVNAIMHAIYTIPMAIYLIWHTVKKADLNNIFRLANDESRVVNETEVYDATRTVNEMKGFIKGSIMTLKFFHIITGCFLIASSIEKLIIYLGG